MSWSRNTKYYTGVVWEYNLPAGHSCPFAGECKVVADRETGKMTGRDGGFRCYAAMAERWPAVRKSRWDNFEAMKRGEMPEVPAGCSDVRIHASGDFYSSEYFDRWLKVCRDNPTVNFWAFTKSLRYWVWRLGRYHITLS